MKIRGSVKTLADVGVLFTLIEKGDCVFVEDEQLVYWYNGEEWQPIENNNLGFSMTNYELNKMVIEAMPGEADIKKFRKEVRGYVNTAPKAMKYIMLLSNELHYYTTFKMLETADEYLEDIVIECLENYGKIKYFEYNRNTNAIEIWTMDETEAHFFMLFDYSQGVIECE